jgi:hypothetical protein
LVYAAEKLVEVEHFDFEGAGDNMSTRDRHTIHMGLAVRKQTVVPAAEPVVVPEVGAAAAAARMWILMV